MPYLRKRGKIWYFQFVDSDGKKKERKGCRDRKATEAMAREAEIHASRVRLGQADPVVPSQKVTVEELLAEYLGFIRSRESTAKHVAQTETRLRAILAGLGVNRLNQLDAVKVAAWLEVQRRPAIHPKTGETVPDMSARTSNHYLTRLRSFVRWAVKHRRLAFDPLTTLEPLDAKLDPRHPRSVLNSEEFETPIRSTLSAATLRNLSGEDRAMLYITAAYTGLRVSELASLSVGSIIIDDHQATIRVQAAYTKNRKNAAQPINRSIPTWPACSSVTWRGRIRRNGSGLAPGGSELPLSSGLILRVRGFPTRTGTDTGTSIRSATVSAPRSRKPASSPSSERA